MPEDAIRTVLQLPHDMALAPGTGPATRLMFQPQRVRTHPPLLAATAPSAIGSTPSCP
jgi:hypothetical protein